MPARGGVVSDGGDWIVRCEGWRTVNPQSNAGKSTARRLWLWPIAILLGFPIGGLIADLIIDGVDSPGSALVEGLIAGVIVGAGRMVRPAAFCLVVLDPGDMRGN